MICFILIHCSYYLVHPIRFRKFILSLFMCLVVFVFYLFSLKFWLIISLFSSLLSERFLLLFFWNVLWHFWIALPFKEYFRVLKKLFIYNLLIIRNNISSNKEKILSGTSLYIIVILGLKYKCPGSNKYKIFIKYCLGGNLSSSNPNFLFYFFIRTFISSKSKTAGTFCSNSAGTMSLIRKD